MVVLAWLLTDFGGNPPSKTDLCVEIGSQISADISEAHKPGPDGGRGLVHLDRAQWLGRATDLRPVRCFATDGIDREERHPVFHAPSSGDAGGPGANPSPGGWTARGEQRFLYVG